jgi:hypothetical protein
MGILYLVPPLLPALVLAFVALPYSKNRGRSIPARWPAAAWAIVVLLTPAILNLLLMRTGGAFWDRYCITSAFSFYILVAIALGWSTGFRRSSAIAAALVLAAVALFLPYEPDSQTPLPKAIGSIRQDLPLVAASGLTFLEMDHYQDSGFQSRLYYLVDRSAAIRYAHSTIFENMPLLTHYFPIRAHVSAYNAFVSEHPHFMVLSRANFLETWILQKLCSDGAQIRLISSLPGPGKEDYQLYEVQL